MLRYYCLGRRADPGPITWTRWCCPGLSPPPGHAPAVRNPPGAEPAGAEPLGAEPLGAEPAGVAPVQVIGKRHADRVAEDALPAVVSDGGRFAESAIRACHRRPLSGVDINPEAPEHMRFVLGLCRPLISRPRRGPGKGCPLSFLTDHTW